MRATVVFWTWPLYDTPSAGFFVSLAGLVNAFNVCVRVWKSTDGDIAYLSEKGLLFSLADNEKVCTAHIYGLAVGVNDLFFACAEFGGLSPGSGGTGGVQGDSGERHRDRYLI